MYDVGRGASKDLIGMKVTTEINVSCGRCWFCTHGMRTHCPYREIIGISIDGGMAEYVLAPQENIHSIEGLGFDVGAFVEPLAAVVEMVNLERPPIGGNIAILGSGTIGLLSLQVIKLLAPANVVVITRPNSPKAVLAKELGADVVLSINEVEDYIRRQTPEGQGFDYVVEATGNPSALDFALKIVRPRGVIAAKSTHGVKTSFDYTLAVVKEVRIVGSRCGPFRPAIRLLRSRLVRVKELITSVYDLEQALNAFKKSFERDQVKVHIKP